MKLRVLLLSACIATLACVCAFAQTVTGSLVGIVVDPSGSVIPDVKLQLTNEGTSATSSAVADNSGVFRFANLLPATYSVAVQAKGFKTRVIKDVTVGLTENR